MVKRTKTWTEAFVKEFLDSLFTRRTLLATSLINGAKDEQKQEEAAAAAARVAEEARAKAAAAV